MTRTVLTALFLALALSILSVFLSSTVGFHGLELKWLDLLFYLRGPQQPSPDLVIVAIDDPTLGSADVEWPWPDSIHARLIDLLTAAGARTIGLDLFFFSDRDPDSEGTTMLAGSIRKAGNVVLAGRIETFGTSSALRQSQSVRAEAERQRPIPLLLQAGASFGYVNMPYDQDGVLRRTSVCRTDREQEPSFPLAVLGKNAGADRPDFAQQGKVKIGDHEIPYDRRGSIFINFNGPAGTFPTVSYSAVLDGSVPRSVFRNKIILVGKTHQGAPDMFQTPFFHDFGRGVTALMPGVEVIANAIDTIVTGRPIRQTGVLFRMLAAVLLASLTALWTMRTKKVFFIIAGLAAILSVLAALSVYLFSAHRIWMETIGPVLLVVCTGPAVFLYRHSAEQKTLMQEIVALKDFDEDIMESMSEGLIVVDRNGLIQVFNRAAEVMTGRSRQEMLGRSASETDPGLTSMLEHGSGAPAGEEVTFHDRQGHQKVMQVTSSELKGTGGRKAGAICIIRDITEIKELNEQLRLKEHLAAIGEFSSGIAHEFKNRMGAIRLWTENLAGEIGPNQNTKEIMGRLSNACDGLHTMVHELLQFSRPRDPVMSRLNLNDVLIESLMYVSGQIQEHKVKVIKELDPDLPVSEGDPGLLSQAFVNILLNAVQATMQEGGILTIRSRIPDAPEQDPAYAIVEISDTGYGIPETLKNRIFLPFVSGKKRGTGLGLATVHRIITAHQGRISFQSQTGKGTTFTIHLPLQTDRGDHEKTEQEQGADR